MKHWLCSCGKTFPDCHAAITVETTVHSRENPTHIIRIDDTKRPPRKP